MNSKGSSGLVAGLAWADLKHEWILSLCLFLAVAAVVGPLLLLFGLKHGTMETLRSRLLQDPRNREIRPMVSRSFSLEWLQKLQGDPRVAFLVPATRSISASVTLKSGSGKLTLEAQPSAKGDPLLMENNADPPEGRQCVLSAEAARKLKTASGDELELEVKRLKGSRFEYGRIKVTISGILDSRGTGREVVFFPLTLLESIESFKDGQAVPGLGWKGSVPLAKPVFNGVVVGLNIPIDPVLKVSLISGTGLSRLEEVNRGQQKERLGYRLENIAHTYLVTTKKALGKTVLTTVRQRLRGRNALVLPWVKPLEVELEDGRKMQLMALPDAEGLQAPWKNKMSMGAQWRQIILPRDMAVKTDIRLKTLDESPLIVSVSPVRAPAFVTDDALVPPDLAGVLNLSRRREITWLPEEDRFVLKRMGYAAFRLYAGTLDHVEPLKLALEDQGIPVHTEAERIRDLKELDRHLSMIFWLISLGGLLGGAGALSASLYASVERKRRDLGVLGLIGFGSKQLLGFPLFQALFLALGGLFLALAFYAGMAEVINRLFACQLSAGERFCRLTYGHLAFAASGVIISGQTAAALAGWRVITIDPAEALRDE